MVVASRRRPLQKGIRQQSLRKHCRLGRATQLVFVMATGALVTLGDAAYAQAVWNGTGADYGTAANWTPNDVPDVGGENAVFDDTGAAQPTVDLGGATFDPDNVSIGGTTAYTLQNGNLTANVTNNSTANQILDVGITGSVAHDGTGTLTLGAAGGVGSLTIANGAGTVLVSDADALAGNASINVGIPLTASGGNETLDLGGSNVAAFQIVVQNGGVVQNGTLTLNDAGPNSANVQLASGTVSANLAGDADIAKISSGTGTLSGANTYTGTTTISDGILVAGNNSALGATAAGTIVQAGGGLELGDGVTIAGETLQIAGAGNANDGALRAGNGSNAATVEYAGAVTLTADAKLRANSGDTLTVSGTVALGANTLTVDGNGATTISGAVSGTGGITRDGLGTGTLTLSGTNTYTGTTTVNDGIIVISGQSASTDFDVNAATLRIASGASFNTAATNDVDVTGAGLLDIDASASFGATSTLDVSSGSTVDIADNQTLSVGTTTNAGTIEVNSNATLAGLSNTLNNNNVINVADGGSVIDAGAINNNATGVINFAGNATFDADSDDTNGAGETITNVGVINLNGSGATVTVGANAAGDNGLTNEGNGDINVGDNTLDLADGGTFTNNDDATLDVAASGSVSADTFDLNNGTVTNAGGSVTATTTIDIASDATLTATGSATITGGTTGTVNAGTVNAGGTINDAVDNTGDFNVTGDLAANDTFDNTGSGTLNVSGGNLSGVTTLTNASNGGTVGGATGGVNIDGGQELTADAIVNNGPGEIVNAGTLTASGGQIDNNTGAVLTSTGTVNGGALNNGTINAEGTFNGAVSNQGAGTDAGTFNVTGALSGDTSDFTNVGEATLNVTGPAGSNFTDVGALTNSSDGATAGPTDAGVVISAGNTLAVASVDNSGEILVQTDGTLTSAGAIASTAGELVNNGTVNGNVNATGGTLLGQGNFANDVTVGGGATIGAGTIDGGAAFGGEAAAATLTIGGALDLDGRAEFDLVSSGTSDIFQVGTADLSGATVDVNSAAAGTYRIINGDAANAITGFGTANLANAAAGSRFSTEGNGQFLNVVIGATTEQYWDNQQTTGDGAIAGGNGTWNAANTNWTDSNGQFNDSWQGTVSPPVEAIFQTVGGTVEVDGTQGFAALTFDVDGYVIVDDNAPAGELQANAAGSSTISVNGAANTATINADISEAAAGTGIVKAGAGIAVLGGTNTYTGTTQVNEGTLQVTGGSAIIDTGEVTVADGAAFAVAQSETIGSLSGTSGAAVAITPGQTLTTGDAGDDTYAGTLTGGSLTKQGAGELTLSGGTAGAPNTLEDLTVSAGTLSQTGVLDASGAIVNDATLANSGTLGGGTFVNNATLTNSGILNAVTSITNIGTFTSTGTVDGGASGTSNSGTIEAQNVFNGAIANTANGTFDVTAALSGDDTFTNSDTAQLNVLNGSFTGLTTVTNSSDRGDGLGGAFGVDIANGRALSAEEVTNVTGGDIRVAGTLTTANGTTNEQNALLEVTGTGTVNGGVTNDGTFNNAGTTNGGLVNQANGVATNSDDINGGVENQLGGQFTNSAGADVTGGLDNDGTATNDGTVDTATNSNILNNNNEITGTLLNDGGTTTNTGVVSGLTTITGGEVDNNNLLDGGVLVDGGTLDNNAGGTVNDGVTITTGDATNEATINDGVTNAGTFTNETNGDVNGTLTNTGIATNSVGATMEAVVNDGGQFSNAGTIASLENDAGTSTNTGTVSGTTVVDGGTIVNDAPGNLAGAVTVNGGGTLDNNSTVNSGVTVASNGTATNSGTIAGAIDTSGTFVNEAGGTLQNGATVQGGTLTNDGTVNGTLTNAATAVNNNLVAGDVVSSVDFTNAGQITGQATQTGGVFSNSGTIGGFTDVQAGTFTNTGSLADGLTNVAQFNSNGGSITGPITNSGTFTQAGSTTATGTFTNTGTFIGQSGSLTGLTTFDNTGVLSATNGRFRLGAGTVAQNGSFDLQDGSVNDTLVVAGDLQSNNGTYNLDIDLSQTSATTGTLSDQIEVQGTLSGTGTVNFNQTNPLLQLQDSPIVVIDADANTTNGSFTATGLPATNGILVYSFEQQGNDYVVTSQANPGVGGVAGTVTLVQSLIGTIVNRPSAPFVSALLGEPEELCAPGTFGRITGGQAEANAQTTNLTASTSFGNAIELNYGGVQLGFDGGCYNTENGLDFTIGGTVGANAGRLSQPLEGSVTDASFQQGYIGLYSSVALSSLAADLSVRYDFTSYDFTNPILGLNDTSVNSENVTVNGSVSYTARVGERFALVPTIGFSYSRISIDDVDLLPTGVTGFNLNANDYNTIFGFAGLTFAGAIVDEEEARVWRPFVTGTVYNDFGDEPTSIFTDLSNGVTQTIQSENLGTFGEVSAGLNVTQLLGDDELGRQVDASVRLDYRFGERVDALGVTAQVRLNF